MIQKLSNMLYCTRTMAKFSVRTDTINIFYNSTIGGAMRYCIFSRCGSASKVDIEHIDSIIRKASIVTRIPQPIIDSIYAGLLITKLNMVWTDTKHPLHTYLGNNNITRCSDRLRVLPQKTN